MNSSFKLKSLIISIVIIIAGCSVGGSDTKNNPTNDTPLEGKSIEEDLANYNFTHARAFLSEIDDRWEKIRMEEKIVTAESAYWLTQKDFDKALSVLNESTTDTENDKIKVYDAAVMSYCEEKNWAKAMAWALKAPTDKQLSGWSVSEGKESAQMALKKKIKEFKELEQ